MSMFFAANDQIRKAETGDVVEVSNAATRNNYNMEDQNCPRLAITSMKMKPVFSILVTPFPGFELNNSFQYPCIRMSIILYFTKIPWCSVADILHSELDSLVHVILFWWN